MASLLHLPILSIACKPYNYMLSVLRLQFPKPALHVYTHAMSLLVSLAIHIVLYGVSYN